MGVTLQIAFRNLLQAPRRTMFLSIALAMVTLLLVMLLSLSQGLTETMVRSATTLSAGHVNVAGFFKASAGDAAPIVTELARVRKIVEENTPGLDYVVDRHRGWARVVSETSSLQAGLTGIDITEDLRFRETIQLAPESEYEDGGSEVIRGDLARLSEPNSVLLFAAQAKRLEVDVGDQLTIVIETLDGSRNTGDVTVVAIAKDLGMMSNWSMFMPKQAILDLYRIQPDTSGAVMIYLEDIDEAENVMAHLRKVFEKEEFRLMDHDPQAFWMKFERVSGEDWLGQKLDLTLWKDEVSFMQWVLTAVSTVSFLLIAILLVIIIVGIMNSMYISVRERTREVGTVRAIGMSKWSVLNMFMFEATILGFVATSIGALLGGGLAMAIDAANIPVPIEAVQAILMSDTIHLSVGFYQLAAAVLVFTFVTACAALWPAIRAAQMQPVDAIHAVG